MNQWALSAEKLQYTYCLSCYNGMRTMKESICGYFHSTLQNSKLLLSINCFSADTLILIWFILHYIHIYIYILKFIPVRTTYSLLNHQYLLTLRNLLSTFQYCFWISKHSFYYSSLKELWFNEGDNMVGNSCIISRTRIWLGCHVC
jgi:hypothetical protein